MRVSRLLVSVLAITIFPVLLFAQKPAEEFKLESLKRGLPCYGFTVLEDQKVQKIKLRIADDIQHPLVGNKRLVLAEMENGMPVVAGMSGSPIYCNGKLLGALSFRFGMFPLKKGLAGITPISYMRDQLGNLGRMSGASSNSTGMIQPIEIPLSMSGADFKEIGKLNREMPSENFVFVSGDASQKPLSDKLGKVSPGDSVTMFFARGDVTIGGTCTATEVTEKTFSLCGHPFMGQGEIRLPAYRSSVAKTFQSSFQSYKLVGKILEPIGTVVYDNAFAVEGVREILPNTMVPVKFSVNVDQNRYNYQFEVFRNKFYTSAVTAIGLRRLLEPLWPETKLGTAKLAAKIYLKGRKEPIEIYDASLVSMQRMQLGFMEGYADPLKIIGNLQEDIATIQQSEWNFEIDRIEISLDIWTGNRILMLDSVSILDQNGKTTEEVRMGDKVTIVMGMRSEDSKQKLVRKFTVEIPKNLNLVKPSNEADTSYSISIHLMSGTKYREMDPKKLPKAEPDTAEDFLKLLRLNQRDPSEIFAVIVLPPEYQQASQTAPAIPVLRDGVWNSVDSLEFLRERQTASEPRVLYIPLGAPLKDGIVSFSVSDSVKLMLK